MLQNRSKYGSNCLTPPATTPWWIKYLMCYADLFMLLLLFGGVLCFVAYGVDQSDPTNLYLGVVLFLVVIISGGCCARLLLALACGAGRCVQCWPQVLGVVCLWYWPQVGAALCCAALQ